MLFFCDNSDVDHSPNSACPMDMTLLLSGSKILIWRHHQWQILHNGNDVWRICL